MGTFLADEIYCPSVHYWRHIGAEVCHPLENKLQAIKQAPIPKNVTEFRSVWGLLNYYGSFISNRILFLAFSEQLVVEGKLMEVDSEM